MSSCPLSRLTAVNLIFYFMRMSLLISFSSQMWDETFQRVTNEQEIYEGSSSTVTAKILIYCSNLYLYLYILIILFYSHFLCLLLLAQLHDLMQLKQENSYLTTIARQISPYILSIAKVKERLEPRCCIQRMYYLHTVLHLLPYYLTDDGEWEQMETLHASEGALI